MREEREKERRREGKKGRRGEGGEGGKGEKWEERRDIKDIHGNNVETIILLPREPCRCLLLVTLDGDVHKLFSFHFSQILGSAHSLPVTGFLLSVRGVSHVQMSASLLPN